MSADHPAFEAWWQRSGQYSRAGGGDYEKTFAFNAWQASRKAALEEAQDACRLPQADSDNASYRAGYDHSACECRNKIKELL